MILYVVRSGDTLTSIARRYSTSVDQLAFDNQLQNPELLSVGQALVIPQSEIRYTVQRGDTVYGIARQYGVSPQRLLAANPEIRDPNRISPGQVIRIPLDSENLGEIAVNGYITDGGRIRPGRDQLLESEQALPHHFSGAGVAVQRGKGALIGEHTGAIRYALFFRLLNRMRRCGIIKKTVWRREYR